jgi:hypothetical protein
MPLAGGGKVREIDFFLKQAEGENFVIFCFGKKKGRLVTPPTHTHTHTQWQLLAYIETERYGWTGQQSSSGFFDLAPLILHYNWF